MHYRPIWQTFTDTRAIVPRLCSPRSSGRRSVCSNQHRSRRPRNLPARCVQCMLGATVQAQVGGSSKSAASGGVSRLCSGAQSVLEQGSALPSLINRQALSFCAARRGDGCSMHSLMQFGWQHSTLTVHADEYCTRARTRPSSARVAQPGPAKKQLDMVSLRSCSGATCVVL